MMEPETALHWQRRTILLQGAFLTKW